MRSGSVKSKCERWRGNCGTIAEGCENCQQLWTSTPPPQCILCGIVPLVLLPDLPGGGKSIARFFVSHAAVPPGSREVMGCVRVVAYCALDVRA